MPPLRLNVYPRAARYQKHNFPVNYLIVDQLRVNGFADIRMTGPMTPKPKPKLEFETEWLREYARTYLPIEAGLEFSPQALRRSGVTLLDIRNAFRFARVIAAEKLDEPGAFWIVEGRDCDGAMLSIAIIVISETYSVRLCEVTRTPSVEDESDDA